MVRRVGNCAGSCVWWGWTWKGGGWLSTKRGVQVVPGVLLSPRREGAQQCLKKQLVFSAFSQAAVASASDESSVYEHQPAAAVLPRATCSVHRHCSVPTHENILSGSGWAWVTVPPGALAADAVVFSVQLLNLYWDTVKISWCPQCSPQKVHPGCCPAEGTQSDPICWFHISRTCGRVLHCSVLRVSERKNWHRQWLYHHRKH